MSHKTLLKFVRMEPASFKPVVRLRKLQNSSASATTTTTTVDDVQRITKQEVKDPETLCEVCVPPSYSTATSTVFASSSSAATTSTVKETSTTTTTGTTTEISLAIVKTRGTYACPDCSEQFPFLKSLYHHSAEQHYQQKVEAGQITQNIVQLVIQFN